MRIRAWDEFTFHVSTDPAERFDVEFYRLGYYGDAGGRRGGGLSNLEGST
jgi:hypothetical protein